MYPPSVTTVLIVNPASAGGSTGRHLDGVVAAARQALGEVEVLATGAVGDGARLAREAAGRGARLVVAAGGDGTASEVVDGLVAAGYRGEFGFLPRGTGGDLRRTLGLPREVAAAARALAEGRARAIDVGRVEFVGEDGRPAARHFVNVASCGITGEVALLVNRSSKVLGGTLSFKLAAARALLRWRDRRVRWRADGGPWTEAPITALSACNARYFGGGMLVAPAARIDDGLLDVTLWGGFGILDFVVQQRKLYDGRHVSLAKTRTLRARTLEVEPLDPAPVLLEADGEQPGRLPARFSILPGALLLRGGA